MNRCIKGEKETTLSEKEKQVFERGTRRDAVDRVRSSSAVQVKR